MSHGFYIEKQNVSHAFRLKKVTVSWIYIYIFWHCYKITKGTNNQIRC